MTIFNQQGLARQPLPAPRDWGRVAQFIHSFGGTLIRFSLMLIVFVGVTSGVSRAKAATNDFTLTCVPCGNFIACTLRNASTNTISYSSYTLGYHEAIVIERYNAAAVLWERVPLAPDRKMFVKGAGARQRDLRSVVPGAVVPAEQRDFVQSVCPGEFSFVVAPAAYALPRGEAMVLRITQVLGTMLSGELKRSGSPVWNGAVVSNPINYKLTRPLGGVKITALAFLALLAAGWGIRTRRRRHQQSLPAA